MEASDALHLYIRRCAIEGAKKKWRSMGARNAAEARGCLTAYIRRDLGVVAARAVAACLLEKIGVLASGDPAGAARRRQQQHQADYRRREEFYRWNRSSHVRFEEARTRGG